MNEQNLRAELCLAAKRLWERGLIVGAEGNLSCRLDGQRLLATPAGRIKADLHPDDIVLADLNGRALDGRKPSSEILLHVRIYAEVLDCGAVVHAHPPIATGFSVAGRAIPENTLPEADRFLGPVALVPYAEPGTSKMGEVIAPFLSKHKTFLLGHHGAATIGDTIEEAFCRMECLEQVAKIILTADQLGRINEIPS